VGTQNNDQLTGGSGNDVFMAGPGSDQMTGGSGADRFVFKQGDGAAVVVNGGTTPVTVNLSNGFDWVKDFGISDKIDMGALQVDGTPGGLDNQTYAILRGSFNESTKLFTDSSNGTGTSALVLYDGDASGGVSTSAIVLSLNSGVMLDVMTQGFIAGVATQVL
jgi:Ca2+-binding RTX toxin-like protein